MSKWFCDYYASNWFHVDCMDDLYRDPPVSKGRKEELKVKKAMYDHSYNRLYYGFNAYGCIVPSNNSFCAIIEAKNVRQATNKFFRMLKEYQGWHNSLKEENE